MAIDMMINRRWICVPFQQRYHGVSTTMMGRQHGVSKASLRRHHGVSKTSSRRHHGVSKTSSWHRRNNRTPFCSCFSAIHLEYERSGPHPPLKLATSLIYHISFLSHPLPDIPSVTSLPSKFHWRFYNLHASFTSTAMRHRHRHRFGVKNPWHLWIANPSSTVFRSR